MSWEKGFNRQKLKYTRAYCCSSEHVFGFVCPEQRTNFCEKKHYDIVLNMANKMRSLSYTMGHSCFLFVLSRVLWGLRSSTRISHIGKLKLSFIVRNILHYGSKVLITYQGTIKIGYTPVEPRVVPIRVVDIGT